MLFASYANVPVCRLLDKKDYDIFNFNIPATPIVLNFLILILYAYTSFLQMTPKGDSQSFVIFLLAIYLSVSNMLVSLPLLPISWQLEFYGAYEIMFKRLQPYGRAVFLYSDYLLSARLYFLVCFFIFTINSIIEKIFTRSSII